MKLLLKSEGEGENRKRTLNKILLIMQSDCFNNQIDKQIALFTNDMNQ